EGTTPPAAPPRRPVLAHPAEPRRRRRDRRHGHLRRLDRLGRHHRHDDLDRHHRPEGEQRRHREHLHHHEHHHDGPGQLHGRGPHRLQLRDRAAEVLRQRDRLQHRRQGAGQRPRRQGDRGRHGHRVLPLSHLRKCCAGWHQHRLRLEPGELGDTAAARPRRLRDLVHPGDPAERRCPEPPERDHEHPVQLHRELLL
ncbi:MAG: hypothetical protein AVDCRST_MAG34-1830, partial [uncultured Nocardioidaceae bacterium]